MLFRTYDFHVLLRGQYQVVLNSDLDNGFGVNAVIAYQKKETAERKAESGGLLSGIAKGIGYTVLGIVALSLITAVASN